MVVVVVVNSNDVGSAQEWTRQPRWHVRCGEAVCIVYRKLATHIYV